MENLNLKEQRCKFDEAVIAKLGEPATENNLPEEDLTPTYDTHVNDMTEGKPDASDEDRKPTQESSDKYVNTDIMLPRGGNLLKGQFI